MSRSCLRVAVLSLVAQAMAACGQQRGANTPTLSIDPPQFTFPKLELGESRQSTVTVGNDGKGKLVIGSIDLGDQSTDHEFTLQMQRDGGALEDVVTPQQLSQGEHFSLIVTYAPSDDDIHPDHGTVTLETNDANFLSAVIPIGGEDQGAEIVVSPNHIDFGPVNANDRSEKPLEITNIGVAPLIISDLAINGSGDFSLTVDGAPVADNLADVPLVIQASESKTLTVTYAPLSAGPDGADLHIRSNDRVQADTVVGLSANGAAACIRVVPDNVDFGASLKVDSTDPTTATPNVQTLIVESCGGTRLDVSAIEITGTDADAFHITETFDAPADGSAPLFTLPAMAVDQPPPSQTLHLEFRPTEERAYGGRIVFHTNAQPATTEVVLFGRGVENQCPIPATTTDTYNVRPLDIITLDGTPSTDPGGSVKEWHWTITQKPDGSSAKLVESYTDPTRPADGGPDDDPTTPQAFFFVDVAGEYQFELVAVDDLGQESCAPVASALVSVSAVPDKDLHIQLVWVTPDDPDETDLHGTDVDLHLRHELADGKWNGDANGFDCYFSNKQPDWGVQNDPADNPSLDIDDTNGAGPENINLARPESVTYDVAALYYRADGAFGLDDQDPTLEHMSLVTIRVYVRGELLGEWLDREMDHRADLWWVASVRWCDDLTHCPEITTVDRVMAEAEYTTP